MEERDRKGFQTFVENISNALTTKRDQFSLHKQTQRVHLTNYLKHNFSLPYWPHNTDNCFKKPP